MGHPAQSQDKFEIKFFSGMELFKLNEEFNDSDKHTNPGHKNLSVEEEMFFSCFSTQAPN